MILQDVRAEATVESGTIVLMGMVAGLVTRFDGGMSTCHHKLIQGAKAATQMRRLMERTGKTLAGQPLWTDAEVDACRQLYPDYKALKLRMKRRSREAIRHKCNQLGLSPHRVAWTGADIARLRKLYPTASREELLIAFPGRTIDAIRVAANKRRIMQVRKPYAITGHAPLDELRARCFEKGYTMPDLDQYARSGKHFQRTYWRADWYSDRFVARAIRALGGKIKVEWDDDLP